MAVHTEIDVLEHVHMDAAKVTEIIKAAKADCVSKLTKFDSTFDINNVNINVDYELICRVKITPNNSN